MRTQSQTLPPFELLRQAEHARLAGSIAESLLPEVFGDLSPEVIDAIKHHDDGWDTSDEAQMAHIMKQTPRSFTAFSAEETLPCWIRSIEYGRQRGPLAGVLISRHCCLLGTGSGAHSSFVAEEAIRRLKIEQSLPFTQSDLGRWTAALGFCDLLSLYLCSGSQAAVTLPLAHPEQREAQSFVSLRWANGKPVLSRPLIRQHTYLVADGTHYLNAGLALEPTSIEWDLVSAAD